MKRLAFVAVVLVALAAPANGDAALFFLFERPAGVPNELVTVRSPTSTRATGSATSSSLAIGTAGVEQC